MADQKIVQKLALERCRVHLSHICALTHLSGRLDEMGGNSSASLNGLFESLHRDLTIIEELIVE